MCKLVKGKGRKERRLLGIIRGKKGLVRRSLKEGPYLGLERALKEGRKANSLDFLGHIFPTFLGTLEEQGTRKGNAKFPGNVPWGRGVNVSFPGNQTNSLLGKGNSSFRIRTMGFFGSFNLFEAKGGLPL